MSELLEQLNKTSAGATAVPSPVPVVEERPAASSVIPVFEPKGAAEPAPSELVKLAQERLAKIAGKQFFFEKGSRQGMNKEYFKSVGFPTPAAPSIAGNFPPKSVAPAQRVMNGNLGNQAVTRNKLMAMNQALSSRKGDAGCERS